MEFNHILIFNGERYQLSIDYSRAMQVLPQIPQEIGSKLLKNEDYTVESQVQLEVFQNFLDYWKTSKEPKINSDNLFEYHLLSQEFGLMKDILSKKTDGKDFHISSLKYILNLNDQNTLLNRSPHEGYIALHLDSFLAENEEEMLKIPINSLYNIFFHTERILTDHQKAFDFIDKNKNNDPNLLTLLPSLDSQKLNPNDVIDSITKSQENIGFIPKVSPSIFDSYESQIIQLKEQNQICQSVINKLIFTLLNTNHDSYSDTFYIVIKELVASILHENFYDVNSKFPYEDEKCRLEITPLCIAVSLEDIELVKYLLTKPGIDVNAKSFVGEGKRLFDESIQLFKDEEEKLKIEAFQSEEEITPLYLAIEKENIEIIKLLLDCPKIDVNAKVLLETGTYTIVSAELSSSGIKLARSIVKSPETILQSEENIRKTFKIANDRKEMNAFHLAIEKNNIEIIKLLLSHPELDVNIKSIRIGYLQEAKLGPKKLLSGYNRYAEMSALHLAIDKTKNMEILKLLLARTELDVNVKLINIESNTSFTLLAIGIFGSYYSKSPMLNSLSDTKIPLDKQAAEYEDERKEKTALYYAIEIGNTEAVNLLLSRKGLDINSKSLEVSYLKIALSKSEQLTIQEKAPEIAKKIEDGKKEIKPKKKEETALHLAVKYSNIKIISALLQNKSIDINVINGEGKKPIDLTNDKKIKTLLQKSPH
ncbi:hypothetical protein M9Y10_027081 [Tritrichomonas musculus]|uniref:Ankyrin repeat protein n=1 Tax=Tritrichomonas musculus TaxID=1915356 RepID=A0ABR2H5I7_9EUKA